MNTLESCMAECPIIQGIDGPARLQLLERHRAACLERRLGQIGMLCGMPAGDAKNALTRAAITTSKQAALLAV